MTTRLKQRLTRILLGSPATFRNWHRNWLYLGFLALIVVLIGLARWRGLGG